MHQPRISLFVPADRPERFGSAGRSAADNVVLDLEDAVVPANKVMARASLDGAASQIPPGVLLTVRVNARPDLLGEDLNACARAGITHVLLPKVDGPEDVLRAREIVDGLSYYPELSILAESTLAVRRLPEILDSGPLATVALGAEDIRQELELHAPGRYEDSPTLLWAHAAVVMQALAAGVMPLGILGSLAEIADLEALGRDGAAAWRLGYRGTYCIHPRQVPVLRAAYGPDPIDLDWAGRVVDEAGRQHAEGHGAFTVDGRMIDAPLVERAHRILAAAPRPTTENGGI